MKITIIEDVELLGGPFCGVQMRIYPQAGVTVFLIRSEQVGVHAYEMTDERNREGFLILKHQRWVGGKISG